MLWRNACTTCCVIRRAVYRIQKLCQISVKDSRKGFVRRRLGLAESSVVELIQHPNSDPKVRTLRGLQECALFDGHVRSRERKTDNFWRDRDSKLGVVAVAKPHSNWIRFGLVSSLIRSGRRVEWHGSQTQRCRPSAVVGLGRMLLVMPRTRKTWGALSEGAFEATFVRIQLSSVSIDDRYPRPWGDGCESDIHCRAVPHRMTPRGQGID